MKKWEVQREANLLAFLEEEEYAKRKEFFFEFVKEFEERKIKWCLFCSSSLYFWGLTDHFNDFDVLIDSKCIPDAIDAMRAIGAKMERREVHGIELDVKRDIDEKEIEKIDQFFKEHAKKDGFASNQYINFSFQEANMDMISGFGLSAMDLKYVYTYNPGNVVNMEIEDKLVPILNPEVLSQFGGVIIFTANDPMKQYLLDNKALLQKHPVGTWIHTPNIGYPWVMWLQSVAKKNNSLLGHNKLKLAVKNKRK